MPLETMMTNDGFLSTCSDTVQICKTFVYWVLFKGIVLYVGLYEQWLDLWWIQMYLRVESKFTPLFLWISATFIFGICYIPIWFYDSYLIKKLILYISYSDMTKYDLYFSNFSYLIFMHSSNILHLGFVTSH